MPKRTPIFFMVTGGSYRDLPAELGDMLTGVAPPPETMTQADRASFHQQIGRLNQSRLVPLLSVLGLFLAVSASVGFLQDPRAIRQWTSISWQNLFGVVLCALVLLLSRVATNPQTASVAYGYAILGWGNYALFLYLIESDIRHSDHAASALVVYYLTRYLAALGVVWRPRNLAVALTLNHVLVAAAFVWLGQPARILNYGVWTATAWLAAYLLYRAERDAFIARLGLQRQRDALSKANAHLERMNQEKNDLMAIAAHDLRSPLMGMTTLLSIAADDASRAWRAGVDTLRALEQSGRDMADLVTRVLDVHQAEEGIDKLSLVAADLRPIATRAVESQMARAQAKDITLTVDTPPEPCQAMLDAHALGRVLDNLGSNAIKFSPRGGRVHVRVIAGHDGAGPTITISDSGPGIRQEDRAKMFRKFARLRAKPTDGESSSGLGLYIVKRLIDAMGGAIAVSGDAGEGATFAVSLAAGSPARSID